MGRPPFHNHSIDIPFSVPCTHRVRFTEDVLGSDWKVLLELLDPGEQEIARVQFWIDENLSESQPDLINRIKERCHESETIRRAGPIQIAPGGENIKNDIHLMERVLKIMNVCDLDRRSYVVVMGGGAVLDAIGFAASIAHRGLRLVRLPSTTLGQSDSAVGVKNGINLFQKKNWLGTFSVPWGVVNDASLLASQLDRDFIGGFAEAVKVALLKDRNLLDDVCQAAQRIARREMSAAMPIIRASAGWHLDHITRGGDPFEENQARPLDFGHWSAHKLEAMSDFELRHGEAVAIGVAVDVVYSYLVHGFPAGDAKQVLECLIRLGFRLDHPSLHDTDGLFAGLEEFRQHLGGQLTLTMLEAVGKPIDVHDIDHESMQRAIRHVVQYSRTGDWASALSAS